MSAPDEAPNTSTSNRSPSPGSPDTSTHATSGTAQQPGEGAAASAEPRYPITWFRAAKGAGAEVPIATDWLTWGDYVDTLAGYRLADESHGSDKENKARNPLCVGYHLKAGTTRGNENVAGLKVAFLDIDNDCELEDQTSRDQLRQTLEERGVAGFLYGSWRDGEERHKFRAAVPLSREVTPAEWGRFYPALVRYLNLPPACVDVTGALKKISQPYLPPYHREDKPAPILAEAKGHPLDVEAVLELADPPNPTPPPRRKRRPAVSGRSRTTATATVLAVAGAAAANAGRESRGGNCSEHVPDEELRAAILARATPADLADMIAEGKGVTFERRGEEFWANCWHGEKTPSMHVYRAKETGDALFKCQGNHDEKEYGPSGGDAIKVAMLCLGLEYPGAVRWWAERLELRHAVSWSTREQRQEVKAEDRAAIAAVLTMDAVAEELRARRGPGLVACPRCRGNAESEGFEATCAEPGCGETFDAADLYHRLRSTKEEDTWGTLGVLAGIPYRYHHRFVLDLAPEVRRTFHDFLGPKSDLGNGARIADEHRDVLRFNRTESRGGNRLWWTWDGRRWVEDTGERAERLAKATVRRAVEHVNALGALAVRVRVRLAELKDAADTEAVKLERAVLEGIKARLGRLEKWAEELQSRGRQAAALASAATEDGIGEDAARFDAERYLLNVENGTLDLTTGELRPHRREDLLSKLCPVAYDPDAECPGWERFLSEIMDGDGELVAYIRRVAGYMLTGETSEQALVFFHGDGSNGKSTFVLMLQELLGEEYGVVLNPSTLSTRGRSASGAEPEVVALRGVRAAFVNETEERMQLAEATVKQLTSRERIKARYLNQNPVEWSPTHKILMAGNHKPEVLGQDHGTWRRIHLVPFEVTFHDPGKGTPEKDPDLLEALREELPGILAWAVRGCLEWQEAGGLHPPARVLEATKAYREEENPVADFVEDVCRTGPGEWVARGELYEAFERWAKKHGYRRVPRRRKFYALVEGVEGVKTHKTRQRGRHFEGVDLLEPPHDRVRVEGKEE